MKTPEQKRKRVQQWQRDNIDHYRKLCRDGYRRRRSTVPGRAKCLLNCARNRARKMGLPCTLTLEWVEERLERGVCEMTGIQFDIEAGKGKQAWSPSLDQRIPRGGYTPENTRLVCNMFNVMKGKWSDEEVMKIAHALVQQQAVQSGA